MLSSEKTNEPILRKLRDRRKDGRTLFYKTLPAEAGSPIIIIIIIIKIIIIIIINDNKNITCKGYP